MCNVSASGCTQGDDTYLRELWGAVPPANRSTTAIVHLPHASHAPDEATLTALLPALMQCALCGFSPSSAVSGGGGRRAAAAADAKNALREAAGRLPPGEPLLLVSASHPAGEWLRVASETAKGGLHGGGAKGTINGGAGQAAAAARNGARRKNGAPASPLPPPTSPLLPPTSPLLPPTSPLLPPTSPPAIESHGARSTHQAGAKAVSGGRGGGGGLASDEANAKLCVLLGRCFGSHT